MRIRLGIGLFTSPGLFCAAGMLLVSVQALAGGPWYVDANTGSDAHNCLAAGSACASLAHAESLSAANDTFHIAAGLYLCRQSGRRDPDAQHSHGAQISRASQSPRAQDDRSDRQRQAELSP